MSASYWHGNDLHVATTGFSFLDITTEWISAVFFMIRRVRKGCVISQDGMPNAPARRL